MVDWHVARFHGLVRRFAISLLSVSAVGMYFVPIGELGRLALLQLDQNIVRLRNTVNWQDSCTVQVRTLLIHTCPIGLLPLSLSVPLPFRHRMSLRRRVIFMLLVLVFEADRLPNLVVDQWIKKNRSSNYIVTYLPKHWADYYPVGA